jgi:8-oxo-dGTP pyrophosphatase MutT (NUDIX family)
MVEDKTVIRNAATVIVVRDRATAPKILMGQRGAKAAFMPNKFVFPGGAVDVQDANISLADNISEPCLSRLADDAGAELSHPLCVAAIRELFEETGQILGTPGQWQGEIPQDWKEFAVAGYRPDASGLKFVFRAITPPGRPRRFDARFFLVDADLLVSEQDDFYAASNELSHLQWIPLYDVRQFDLPFITEVVLAEVAARLDQKTAPGSVPFFKNNEEESLFLRLRGLASTSLD